MSKNYLQNSSSSNYITKIAPYNSQLMMELISAYFIGIKTKDSTYSV